jgi:hypothetical protein
MTTTAEKPTPAPIPSVSDPYEQVCAVYDLHNEVRMNFLYYSKRLLNRQRINLGMEIVIAVTTSATVGTVVVFKSLLPWFAAVSAVLSVIKPILRLPTAIEGYTKIRAAYLAVSLQTRSIVREIQEYHQVTPEMQTTLRSVRHRLDELATQDDAYPSKAQLLKHLSDAEEEMPANTLWCPPQATSAAV